MTSTKISSAQADAERSVSLQLRLLATTDLHGHLLAWDYFANQPALGRGLAAVSSLIARARTEVPNALLFDNGDFLNGSGLGDYMVQILPADFLHPMIAAMNALNYDAVTLGNHEFSHGIIHLAHAVKDARFPIVNSNYEFSDLPFVQSELLLVKEVVDTAGQRHILRFGILGLLPGQTMIWEAPHLQGRATAHPMLDSARRAASRLRANGADIVIALVHSGIAPLQDAGGEEHCADAIARLPDIDAVIAGHSHQPFPTAAHAPRAEAMVLPGFYGSHLGVLDLTLQRCHGKWHCTGHVAALRAVAMRQGEMRQVAPNVPDDPQILALAAPTHHRILAQSEQVIGALPHRLHSYFATIAPSSAMALIAEVQGRALAERLAGTPHQDLPILAAVAPFKAGGRSGPDNYTDLPAGPFRHHHAADLYMHPNSFVGFRVSGHELRLWLERAVSKYNQITEGGQEWIIRNPNFPSFNLDILFGVTYQIDLSQPPMFDYLGQIINPAAQRIVNLRHKGEVVQPDHLFALASNSYRLNGNMGFAGTTDANLIYHSSDLIQHLIRRHVAADLPIPPADPAHWSFAPLPGRTVIFLTSPKAAALADEIAHFRPQPLGLDSDGFQRFRLHL